MTATVRSVRLAVRCSPGERALWEEVTSLMNDGLRGACTFQCVWRDDLCSAADDGCDVLCLSMLPDLWRPRSDWPVIEAEWRLAAAVLRERELVRGATVFVVTIFRYTTGEDCALLPLLRRLNLLAARLSQEFGLFVIDVDRMLAHAGAVNLLAEARLASAEARHSAADTIVETLLSVGIDHLSEATAIHDALSWHKARRAIGSTGLSTPASMGQLKRSHVKGHTQASLSESHDVYGGIRSVLRDLCAPRLGLRWRMPLMLALLRMASGRVSGRIVRQRL
jgi:hypothetical protein